MVKTKKVQKHHEFEGWGGSDRIGDVLSMCLLLSFLPSHDSACWGANEFISLCFPPVHTLLSATECLRKGTADLDSISLFCCWKSRVGIRSLNQDLWIFTASAVSTKLVAVVEITLFWCDLVLTDLFCLPFFLTWLCSRFLWAGCSIMCSRIFLGIEFVLTLPLHL